jgi:outer membrane protein assembly factor BamB
LAEPSISLGRRVSVRSKRLVRRMREPAIQVTLGVSFALIAGLVVWAWLAVTTPDWSMYRADVQRTGRSRDTSVRAPGPVASYFTHGEIVGSVAISARGLMIFGSTDGNLYAIRPGGSRAWVVDLGGPVISSPTIERDGTILVGGGDGRLWALTADGKVKWKRFIGGGQVASSPALGPRGIVYIGSRDGGLYAVGPLGTRLWRFSKIGRAHV